MKPRIRVPCISVFVGATPSESPLPPPPPVSPTEAGNNSVSSVGSLSDETAAVDHSFTGSGSTAAATIPDMPAFLVRDGSNIAPFSLAASHKQISEIDPRIAGFALRSDPSQPDQSTEQGSDSEPKTHTEAF